MMIKLRSNTETGEWATFDECRNVIYDTTRIVIPDDTAIMDAILKKKGWEAQTTHVFHNLEPSDNPHGSFEVIGVSIRWDSSDGSHILFTDSLAIYLMSNTGETIERI